MSNHYLLVDDVRRVYFDLKKYYLDEKAQIAQPFESFLLAANDGEPPPTESGRYYVDEAKARELYAFLVSAGWKARVLCLDDDDYTPVILKFERVALLYGDEKRGPCKKCGKERLLTYDDFCAACSWRDYGATLDEDNVN